MGMVKKISVTVMPEMSTRIENWLIGRNIDYEVEVVRTAKRTRLKIIASFRSDEAGEHHAEVYKRFLERLTK